MTDEKSHSLDVFGVKPIADAISSSTNAAINGATAFLSRICLPAAEEFGLLLQDKVRVWRAANALKVLVVAEERLSKSGGELHAHPRLVSAILEHGSWSDEKTLQEMWGGLLASSCTMDARDESNVIFVSLLSHMTSLQVRVLSYFCYNCKKEKIAHGLISPQRAIYVDMESLKSIAMSEDISRIDRELDNLRGLELLDGGIVMPSGRAQIAPTGLALNLYVRCQGFRGSPAEFFGSSASVPDT